MPAAQRLGDSNSTGGTITSIPQSTVFINGKPASINGSSGTSHPPCPFPGIHCAGVWKTANGNSTVKIGGIPVNATGDQDTCAHTRVGGSGNVNIG